MNSNSSNYRLMNSLLPVNSRANNSNAGASVYIVPVIIFLVVVGLVLGIFFTFQSSLTDTWNSTVETVYGFFGDKKTPAPEPPSPPFPTDMMAQASSGAGQDSSSPSSTAQPSSDSSLMEKILPGTPEVFNVSSNKYTYYDAEPLCKALGAELATYDQVKEAWKKGADWCNYGWVKGQLAVYPTSDETYKKLQSGPEEQRMTCGTVGVNGGHFDNPEMRFGVTCVGNKPAQSKADADAAAKGAPLSPDALAFDKKVSQFKSESGHIGILPFNGNTWSS